MNIILTIVVALAAGILCAMVFRAFNIRSLIVGIVAGGIFLLSLCGNLFGLIIAGAVILMFIICIRNPIGPYGLLVDSGRELLPVVGIVLPFIYRLYEAIVATFGSAWWIIGIAVTICLILIWEVLISFYNNRGVRLGRGIVIILLILAWVLLAFASGTARPFLGKISNKMQQIPDNDQQTVAMVTETEGKTGETEIAGPFLGKIKMQQIPDNDQQTVAIVTEAEDKTGETEIESSWYAFYNLSLSKDNDKTNDFNFGYNLADYYANLTAVKYDKDFRERIKRDPALGAADMAWFDAILGTRYLGVFYEECKGEWASTINSAKDYWCAHQLDYYQTLDAFFAFLDSGKVSLERGSGITDQMYMNPLTPNHIPDVIVMKTNQNDGLFLVYTFMIKGNEFKVMYRTECGYQPTNVEKVMHITPHDKPVNPKPIPTPVPSNPPKDPTQGTQGDPVKPNDNPGPGPDTNNGVGAQTSKVDRDDTSTSYSSYDKYREEMNNLEKINETQKTGSDNNNPAQNVNVDNNGDKGTGNGGINVPTPVEPVAKDAKTGDYINTNPGEAWGGPPD